MEKSTNVRKSCSSAKWLIAGCLTLFVVWAGVSTGIALPVQQERNVVTTNNVHPKVASGEAQFMKHMDGNTQLELNIILPLQDQAGLTELLQQIYDPASPMYRQYLSVEEFTQRFGPTQQDYDAAVNYMQENGLTVIATTPNRLVLDVSGDVPQIENAFNVTLNLYRDAQDGSTFFATDTLPSTPGLQLWYVNGLKTKKMVRLLRFANQVPSLNQAEDLKTFVTGSGAGGQFLGSDMRAAYYGGTALTGAGQSIGLFGLKFNISDVQAYFTTVNQPFNPSVVQTISINGFNTTCGAGCDDGEPVIDIVQALSMAPGVNAVIEYEASNDVDTFNRMATDNVAKQLSASIGFLPADPASDQPIFQQFAAQGQNLFVSSGDSGAYFGNPTNCQNGSNFTGCIFYPADDPFITSVGGTSLTTNGAGGSWQSETSWVGSGGGTSTNGFAIPSYQQKAGVINASNHGSTTLRNIPDIAMEADTDNFFCANGSCQGGVGGTSLSAPRWAGFLALVNEQAAQNGKPPAGFLNPTFYNIGTGSSLTTDFHDITTGNNANSNASFNAVTGYDLVTGWGSPTGQAMIDALAGTAAANFSLSASPASVTIAQAGSGTSTITVTPANGFNGSVSLSASGLPSGVTAAFNPGSTTTSSTLTLSASSTAATGSATVTITGISGSLTHTTTVSLTVTAAPDFTLSASPNTLTITQGTSGTSTISVGKLNGFTGSVSLSSSGLPSGVSASFNPGSTTTTSTLTLTASGTATTGKATVTITGTSGSLSHTTTISLTVNASGGGNVQVTLPFNINSGIVADGTTFTGGGFDNDGSSYSSNLLGSSATVNGVVFMFGPANGADAISNTTVSLPSGQFANLQLLAAGVNGNQTSQTFTVHFSDGTTQSITQSLSDWFTPQNFAGETKAVTMAHRDSSNGTTDNRTFLLYAYVLKLTAGKTVSSVTLPANRNVVVLAMTLTGQSSGGGTPAQVNLSGAFNREGIVTDGTTFTNGGLDGGGSAYSSNLLGGTLSFNGESFTFGTANQSNAVSASGQTVALPSGQFSSLRMLATGVNGNQASQTFTVTFSDGTTSSFTQSISDWFTPQNFAGEATASSMAHRDNSNGSLDNRTFNLYGYSFSLNSSKTVSSITLPNNNNVEVLAFTLVP